MQFLRYAKASCGEFRTQVYIGQEIGYIEKPMAQAWIQESKEISSMLVGLMKSIRSRLGERGERYQISEESVQWEGERGKISEESVQGEG